MDAFVWDQNFITGVEDMDDQHHALVDLFNELSQTYCSTDRNRVIAYYRFGEGDAQHACVVVANFTGQPVENYSIGLPAAGLWKLRFNSDAAMYDPEFSDFPSGNL